MRQAYTSYLSSKFLPAFFFLWLVVHINAQDTALWTDRRITIDGLVSDWELKDFRKDEKAGYSYCISNDTSALYIAILLKDEISKAKFLNAGFSLFLNGDGKEKRSYSIDFPLPDAEYDLSGDPRRLMDLKIIQLMGFLHAKQYGLSGFKDENGRYSTGDENKAGIGISIGTTDSAMLFYEAKIPFTAIFKKITDFSETNQKNIAVCFSFNAVSRPSGTPSQPVSSPPAAGPPRRGSISSPANNPYGVGSQPSQNFGQMEKLFQSSKTWKIINLAKSS